MVNSYYDNRAAAQNYNVYIGYQRRVQVLKQIVKKIPTRYKTVLDLGCGTGAMIDALPKHRPLRIVGVDISEAMLAVAKKNIPAKKNVLLKKHNFLKVNFPSSSFDLITIAHAVRFIPSGKENDFIQKMYKWLKKDGMLVVVRYESVLPPLLENVIRSILFRKKNISPINTREGLLQLMHNMFQLNDMFQTGVVLHRSTAYRPCKIKAYFFSKK